MAKLGGEVAFTQALEKGEVKETEQGGSTFYFFNTITIEKKVGARAETKGSVARTANDAQVGALSAFVESFQPTCRASNRRVHFFIISWTWCFLFSIFSWSRRFKQFNFRPFHSTIL